MNLAPLVAAIYRQHVIEYAAELGSHRDADAALIERTTAAAATCRRIGEQTDIERRRVDGALVDAGLAVNAAPGGPQQHHTIDVPVADADEALAAAAALRPLGYAPWESWSNGALASYRRFGAELVVAHTDDWTSVVRLRWTSARTGTVARALRPTPADWDVIDLPTWAWPAYSAVRAGRLLAERAGWRDRHAAGIGPYLATPDSLIDPLLDVAGVGPDDSLVDLGCGDGRLVVEAARRRGCRALGVEHDATLVELGRARIAAAGVEDRATIVHGDARTAELGEPTVALLFLPAVTVGDIVEVLRARCPAGARLIAHEQSPLPASAPQPDASIPVIATDALTVAHTWTV
ncbi:MAG: methyltransferase domain-containing protein [Actinomycetota bacterium]